jgi:hypothetical protein
VDFSLNFNAPPRRLPELVLNAVTNWHVDAPGDVALASPDLRPIPGQDSRLGFGPAPRVAVTFVLLLHGGATEGADEMTFTLGYVGHHTTVRHKNSNSREILDSRGDPRPLSTNYYFTSLLPGLWREVSSTLSKTFSFVSIKRAAFSLFIFLCHYLPPNLRVILTAKNKPPFSEF